MELAEHCRKIGSSGGNAKWAKIPKEERSEIMREGIRVAIDEFERQVRGGEGEVTNLFVRKVRDALNNLL